MNDYNELIESLRSMEPMVCSTAADSIESLQSRTGELCAARIAYASEFPPDADGLPDTGIIHANIRAMKARVAETAVFRANGFKVNGSEQAQPALTLKQIDKAYEAIREALGDAYDCMRVWSDWDIGTMGPYDFWPVAESDDRVAEIRNAAAAELGFKVDE